MVLFTTEYIVSGKEKGKYLRYTCVSQYSCGGWGNRLGGISVVFTLAVITKRALVISMPLPLDINILMHPKAIMWNHSISHHLSTRKYFMVDPPALNHQWSSFERMLMSNNGVDVMELQTNLGFFKNLAKIKVTISGDFYYQYNTGLSDAAWMHSTLLVHI